MVACNLLLFLKDPLLSKPEDWDASVHVQSGGTELGTLMGTDGSFEAINGEAVDEVTPVEGAVDFVSDL
jgi:hypothetical protein